VTTAEIPAAAIDPVAWAIVNGIPGVAP